MRFRGRRGGVVGGGVELLLWVRPEGFGVDAFVGTRICMLRAICACIRTNLWWWLLLLLPRPRPLLLLLLPWERGWEGHTFAASLISCACSRRMSLAPSSARAARLHRSAFSTACESGTLSRIKAAGRAGTWEAGKGRAVGVARTLNRTDNDAMVCRRKARLQLLVRRAWPP